LTCLFNCGFVENARDGGAFQMTGEPHNKQPKKKKKKKKKTKKKEGKRRKRKRKRKRK
jgi:hypothetical protein